SSNGLGSGAPEIHAQWTTPLVGLGKNRPIASERNLASPDNGRPRLARGAPGFVIAEPALGPDRRETRTEMGANISVTPVGHWMLLFEVSPPHAPAAVG